MKDIKEKFIEKIKDKIKIQGNATIIDIDYYKYYYIVNHTVPDMLKAPPNSVIFNIALFIEIRKRGFVVNENNRLEKKGIVDKEKVANDISEALASVVSKIDFIRRFETSRLYPDLLTISYKLERMPHIETKIKGRKYTFVPKDTYKINVYRGSKLVAVINGYFILKHYKIFPKTYKRFRTRSYTALCILPEIEKDLYYAEKKQSSYLNNKKDSKTVIVYIGAK